jgi:hypothetical protein
VGDTLERAMGEGCGDYYCRYCACADILIDEILRLREELAKRNTDER